MRLYFRAKAAAKREAETEKRPPDAKEDGLPERGIPLYALGNPSVALRATPQLRFAAQPSVRTGPPLHKGGFGMYSTTEKRY